MGDLSRHFSHYELECKCCKAVLVDQLFLDMLEALRTVYRRPMRVSSWFRCPTHNSQVSSTGLNGPHTTGKAIDILVSGQDAFDLLGLALDMGFKGVGINQKGDHDQRFIHLDMTNISNPRLWSY